MTEPSIAVAIGEKDLRRRIDQSLSRALVDEHFADTLLADPTIVLDHRGCAPHFYKALRGIHATNLVDFANQAQAIFWTGAAAVERRAGDESIAGAVAVSAS
jgi:hypothetical protein